MGVVIKVRHLNDGAFHAGIRKLANHSGYPTIGVTMQVGNLCKALIKETADNNMFYHTNFKQFLDEKGQVLPEKKEEYEVKMKEFMETEIPVFDKNGQEIKPLKINHVAKVGLSPAELMLLEPIFDPSAPLEAV
jgi:hypothetical protein